MLILPNLPLWGWGAREELGSQLCTASQISQFLPFTCDLQKLAV